MKQKNTKTKAKKTESTSEKITFIPSDRLRAYTAVEVAEMNIPRPPKYWWVYIVKGRLIMVYGWRGVGKSQFILCLAVGMSTGAKFLGFGPERPLRVVILDGEMDLRTMQIRMNKTNRALGVNPSKNLKIVSPEMFSGAMPSIITLEGQQEIDNALGDQWEVLFIDNYSAFSSGREDSEVWGPCSKWLMKHRRAGRTVIIVHHSGKNGKQRGASNHEDTMDASISISAPPKKSQEEDAFQYILRWEKARHLPHSRTKPMLVTYRKEDGKGSWTKSYDIAADPKHALAIKMSRDGLSQTEISKKLGVNKSTISRWQAEAKSK